MPIYEYQCAHCLSLEQQFAFNGMTPPAPYCGNCQAAKERIISAPARLMFGKVHTKIEITEDPLYKGPDE